MRRNVFQPWDGRASSPGHILGYAGLSDFDVELEKLAMNPRRSPQRTGNAHLADQLANFQRHRRSATAGARFPAPVRSEPRAMPADNGVRLNDRQCIANFREQPIETNEYQSVDGAEGVLFWSSSPQNVYLLSQRPISASSAARDRIRSTTIKPLNLQRSPIIQQHRPILDQLPARLGLR